MLTLTIAIGRHTCTQRLNEIDVYYFNSVTSPIRLWVENNNIILFDVKNALPIRNWFISKIPEISNGCLQSPRICGMSQDVYVIMGVNW